MIFDAKGSLDDVVGVLAVKNPFDDELSKPLPLVRGEARYRQRLEPDIVGCSQNLHPRDLILRPS